MGITFGFHAKRKEIREWENEGKAHYRDMGKDAIRLYQRRMVVRFYVDFKWPEIGGAGINDSDLETLIQIHRLYREWTDESEAEPTGSYCGKEGLSALVNNGNLC